MKRIILVVLGLLLIAAPVQALPTLSWTVSDLGSGYWQYNYTVTNDLNSLAIDSFSIDYVFGLYQALQLDAVPTGWSQSFVYDPYLNLGNPTSGQFWGFADPGFAIAPGESLGGFAVSFLWGLSETEPPLASFEGVREQGDQTFSYTTVTTAPVPEPGTFLLLAAGLVGVIGARRLSTLRKSEHS